MMFYDFVAGVPLPVLPEVCVHRLITEGTYEEQLEKIMARKQDLSSLTVGGPLLRLERGGSWEEHGLSTLNGKIIHSFGHLLAKMT